MIKKYWKVTIGFVIFILFISGFFFIEEGSTYSEQEQEREEQEASQVSEGEKRNSISSVEISKFKINKIEERNNDSNNTFFDTQEETNEYLSSFFADPILGELTDYYFNNENKAEMRDLLEAYIPSKPPVDETEFEVIEENNISMTWEDKDKQITLYLTQDGQDFLINDIDISE